MSSPGQIAYERYCACVNWTSFRGEPLPQWIACEDQIQEAWHAAANAVLENADFATWDTRRTEFIKANLPQSEI